MKPIKCSPIKGSTIHDVDLGTLSSVGNIKGFVKFDNKIYPDSIVYLFRRIDARAVTWFKTKEDGSYNFQGLNGSVNYFTTAFDLKKKYVAVSQDNLIPK